jgi:hypothetical protein
VKAPFSCPQSSEAINDCYNCHAARSNNSFNLQVSVLEQIPECYIETVSVLLQLGLWALICGVCSPIFAE